MKTYYTREETPLKFHKFFHYFLLPCRFFICAIAVSDFLAHFQSYDTFELFVVVTLTILPAILLVVVFVGFFKWTPYSIFSLFVYFLLDIIANLYMLSLYLRYLPEEFASSAGSVFGAIVFAILICIYYWKRRNLFLHKSKKISTPNIDVEVAAGPVNQVESVSQSDIVEDCHSKNMVTDFPTQYCNKCGKKLLRESTYCSYCGTKVLEE